MEHNPTAVSAVIRGVWCEVEGIFGVDDQGPFTRVEVTEDESGLPLFDDDVVLPWHIDQIELLAVAAEYARYGYMLLRAAPEPVLAEVISLPVRDASEVAA